MFKASPDKKRIESFEIISLRLSGMRYTTDYEIVRRGNDAELSQYSVRFTQTERTRCLEKRVVVSAKAVLQLLNDCKILAWNGFHGAHPRFVKDGTMFSLEAIVNDGAKIRADGSENFPRHYRDFTNALYEMLRSGEG